MKRTFLMLLDLLGAILVHVVFVFALSGLAVFVWNIGVVALLPNLNQVGFLVALAIMTGIYIINLFIKSYITKITLYKQQKNLSELLFRSNNDDSE